MPKVARVFLQLWEVADYLVVVEVVTVWRGVWVGDVVDRHLAKPAVGQRPHVWIGRLRLCAGCLEELVTQEVHPAGVRPGHGVAPMCVVDSER